MVRQYDPADPNTDERESQHWTLNKRVPMSLIFAVVVLIATQLVVYGQTKERFEQMSKEVEAASYEYITRETVQYMFNLRDAQIERSSDIAKEIKQDVKENKALLQQILRDMPRNTDNQ